jgi:hypothetical protein
MNNVSKKKQSYSVGEYVKNILLVILFVSVIVLSGMYIVTLNRSGTISRDTARDDITFEKLWTVQDGAMSENTLSQIVTPRFMGFKTAIQNDPAGVSAGEKYINELYKKTGVYLYYALSAAAVTEKIPDAEEEVFWLSLIHSDNYIYIRYHSPIPHQLIQASGGDLSGLGYGEYNRAEGHIVYVKDLFILPVTETDGESSEESTSLTCRIAVRADDDSVYVFTPPASADDSGANPYPGIDASLDEVTKLLVDAYGEGMQKYHFAYSNGDDRALYADKTEVVTDAGIPLKTIRADAKTAGKYIYSRPGDFEQIVRIFNFNPDKINTYSEANNTNIYVETHGSLKIAEDRLSYTARNGVGIPLSDFIGYSHSGSEGDVYDIVRAAQIFIEKIGAINVNYIGRDADLCISGVYGRDNKIVIKYSYFCDNVMLVPDGNEYALAIESDGINITSIDLFTLSAEVLSADESSNISADTMLSYTQKWAAKKHLSDREESQADTVVRVSDMRLVYHVTASDENDENIIPNWSISIQSPDTE